MDKLEKATAGTVAGLLAAVAPAWTRWDDENQRRASDTRDKVDSANARITALTNRGELVRLRIPAVMDALVGLGLANPMKLFPDVLPSNVAQQRPDILSDMVTSVADMSWPPKVGTYTDKGLTAEAGELATLFLALTFEEVRCALQGLVQAKQPTAGQKVQIFRAFNSLVSAVAGTTLDDSGFAQTWARVFGAPAPGGAGATGSPLNPHHDPTLPPAAFSCDPTLATVVALGLPDLGGYPFAHQNTDHVMKWRVTTVGNLSAGTTVITIRFGTPYSKNGMPYLPVVTSSHPAFCAANVTRATVDVKCTGSLAPATVLDFGLVTDE